MEDYNPQEVGAAIGIIEFTLENLKKIETFIQATDYESAAKYLKGLTVILNSEKTRINTTKKVRHSK